MTANLFDTFSDTFLVKKSEGATSLLEIIMDGVIIHVRKEVATVIIYSAH